MSDTWAYEFNAAHPGYECVIEPDGRIVQFIDRSDEPPLNVRMSMPAGRDAMGWAWQMAQYSFGKVRRGEEAPDTASDIQ